MLASLLSRGFWQCRVGALTDRDEVGVQVAAYSRL